MSLRPGSLKAKEFYNQSIESNYNDWRDTLNKYNEILSYLETNNKKFSLKSLDKYKHIDLINNVNSNGYITLQDLSNIMKWKLLRGKFRPLQKLVDSNTNELVISCSKKSIDLLKDEINIENNWTKALDCLTELKGIGEATASAILSSIYPQYFPFMADEVIDVTCNKREYTRKAYKIVRSSLIDKANELNNFHKDDYIWTAEDVGKVIWIKAMIEAHNVTFDSIVNKRSIDSNDVNVKRSKK